MGTPILELSNAENWLLVGSVNKVVEPGNSSEFYYPFDEITLPFLLDSNIFAILVDSPSKKPTWHFAGTLYVKGFLGLTAIDGLPEASLIERQKLWLGEMRLFKIPRLVPNYSITVVPPKWLTQIDIYCWQYTGVDDDSTEVKIDRLQESVNQIGARLNEI